MDLGIAKGIMTMKHFRPLYLLLVLIFLAWFTSSAAAQTAKPLPETYVSDDETLTLRHPTGWVVETDQPGIVIVATSEEMIDLGDDNIPSGEAAVAMVFSNTGDSFMRELFIGDDPTAILNNFINTMFSNGSDSDIEFTTPASTTFDELPAARSDGLFMGNHAFLILNEREDGSYSLIIGITTVDELDKFEPKLLAIAQSINFQPPND
jgi:hypothetical protein